MKKIFGLMLLFTFILIQLTRACTTFFLTKDGQMVFGKNYDWMTGTGSVNTNLRGLAKSSLPLDGGNILKWTSKYGSTTFNQYGKEFPNGGMNEKGLVVELMWLSESEYPNKDNRPGLSVLQWIQYQLDNATTVEEVIASDELVRITSTGTPQHYLVADSKGGVATIEFLDGEMVVRRGDKLPYPVLANSTYESSVKTFKNNKNFEDNNSLDRFSKACSMVQQYQKTNNNKSLVDYSFEILNKVAQGGFTKWSIVYDITNRKVYFKTSTNQQQKSFSLNNFNYSCSSQAVSYNVAQNVKGDIIRRLVAFRNEQNKE
ncbi:MAG TPA: linear amide C-N hydrolase, partial [Segetibacter sp.]|nr:linear amide C-N hydrolase [Segetibacter sp.]